MIKNMLIASFIGAMLLGNNVALVIYSIVMAKFLEPLIITYLATNEFVILITQTIVSTFAGIDFLSVE